MDGSNRIRLLRAKSQEHTIQKQERAKKAVGYVRVSTEEQAAKGYGLEVQERAIRSFAESQAYQLVEIVTDPGESGGKAPEQRPGFRRVLQLAKEGSFSVLLVWKFDRLARNLLFSVMTVNDLSERYHVVIRSVTEPIDTATPMGGMIFAILASFAAEERRVITGRTVAGKKEKAIRGGFAGGAAPLGYVKDRQGGLVINEKEAEIVRQIVAMRKQGLSLQAIATKLNEVGIGSKRGAKFHPSTIHYVLDNPKYRGVIEYLFRHDDESHCLSKGVHEPILRKAA